MSKICVEDCYRLPVRLLIEHQAPYAGSIRWSSNGEEVGWISFVRLSLMLVRLRYKVGDENVAYEIGLNTTRLAWDKERYWFTCPTRRCQRRVRDLYLPSGGTYFACRHCYNLTYRSNQQESRTGNLIDRLLRMLEDR